MTGTLISQSGVHTSTETRDLEQSQGFLSMKVMEWLNTRIQKTSHGTGIVYRGGMVSREMLGLGWKTVRRPRLAAASFSLCFFLSEISRVWTERRLLDKEFKPIPGAGGYQVSNPSAIDLASLCAALSVFNETTMKDIRKKSIQITAYLEHLLLEGTTEQTRQFQIITPSDPAKRGAQLSLLLKPGCLQKVEQRLQDAGIICDKREPDVLRVAPAPLYNTYDEVRSFVEQLNAAFDS
jgi:hypothetical protein